MNENLKYAKSGVGAAVGSRRTETVSVEALVRAYRERGDRRSLERVLELHGRLLNHIAVRYARVSHESHDDLVQIGYVGLIKAVNAYEADTNARFGSYAYAMIDGEIRHHLRDAELVKKPRWARTLYAKVTDATARLTAELGRPPLVEEISREVNVEPAGIIELMKLYLNTNVASLDDDAPDLSAIKSTEYEAFTLPVEDRIQLEQALDSLSELQRQVVDLFFYKDLSQTEIGKKLGLPQRKISRIVADSVKSLRERLKSGM